MRFIVSLVVLVGCTGYGYVYANEMQRRLVLLQELKSAWQTMQTRIQFFQDPLQQAFMQTSTLLPSHAKGLFVAISERIQETNDVPEAMEKSLDAINGMDPIFACLLDRDKKAHLCFAERLGKDSNTQRAAFGVLDSYLHEEIEQGQQRVRSQSRLYKSSGLLFGLLLVVLFL